MATKIPPAKILVNRNIDFKSCQHPGENFFLRVNAFWGILTLAGLIWAVMRFPRILALAGGALIVIFIIVWSARKLRFAGLLGNSIRASEDNFPEIQYIKNVVVKVLEDERPWEVQVSARMRLEPQQLSLGNRRQLLLNEQLVSTMLGRHEVGQLIWLLGRTLAMPAQQRRLWLIVRGLLFMAYLNPVAWLFLLLHRRLKHFTADRVGLALNLSLIDAAEAFKKMISGTGLHSRANFTQLDHQALALNRSVFVFLTEIISGRPALVRRYAALIDFCRVQYPDLYADFELHRQYALNLLPSYREVQEFSEGKEEEKKILRDLGKLVYEFMSELPPLNEADAISRSFLQLHRNRDAAAELEAKIGRLDAAKGEWESVVAKINAAEQKRENANRALEASYREIGRTAFAGLREEIPKHPSLQKIFEKAQQYQVVIADRENEIVRLEASAGGVFDKSRRKMEVLALRTQNVNDGKRMQATAEVVGEEFWKHFADQFQHDDLEPIKLRITGIIAELERRRLELENLHTQKRDIEKRIEPEGLSSTAKPDVDIPVFIEQLKNQARAANALRPRLLENLGKAYWQHERDYHPDTRGVIEQLNDLKKRIRGFEQEENSAN
jgi:hypothetical protein